VRNKPAYVRWSLRRSDKWPSVATVSNLRTSNSIEPKSNFHTDLQVYRTAILHGGLEAPAALFVHGLRKRVSNLADEEKRG
jgi:hypothetical protein